MIGPILSWVGQQGKWFALLVFVLALAALYVFGVPLGDAWKALFGS